MKKRKEKSFADAIDELNEAFDELLRVSVMEARKDVLMIRRLFRRAISATKAPIKPERWRCAK